MIVPDFPTVAPALLAFDGESAEPQRRSKQRRAHEGLEAFGGVVCERDVYVGIGERCLEGSSDRSAAQALES